MPLATTSLRRVLPALLGGTPRKPPVRILCHFHHYYGRASSFYGKSTSQEPGLRRELVERALRSVASLPHDVTIRVCGLPGQSLLPIDEAVAAPEPPMIIYASIEAMAARRDQDFTHFLAIEDDIEVNPGFIRNAIDFAGVSEVNEVWLPNRIEHDEAGRPFCVDLGAWPGWHGLRRHHGGQRLDIARNPHSGLAFLSRAQLRYAAARVDFTRRERIIGHYMESAFANLHAPFLLWRARDDLLAHHVVHLDRWGGPRTMND